MKSISYWHPSIYSILIRLSYGRYYRQRYDAIRELIDENGALVDVCCGDCKLYDYLHRHKRNYLGLDSNDTFINIAKKRGINAKTFDLYKDEIPRREYVIMQGSLYQFHSRIDSIITKLLHAASKSLIISEPVINSAHSKSQIMAYLSRKLSNPGDGEKEFKFDKDSLKKALLPYRKFIKKEFFAANNIDYVVVMQKN